MCVSQYGNTVMEGGGYKGEMDYVPVMQILQQMACMLSFTTLRKYNTLQICCVFFLSPIRLVTGFTILSDLVMMFLFWLHFIPSMNGCENLAVILHIFFLSLRFDK